ncbi:MULTISPECIES: ABC transporter ATP-binding protein [unclassified Mesorhizobium]|uniref:ABC transporter ATP-binding protein n=1 Tax=unclassified Mesorhizobium TaxID=325217 RepID=UPI001CCCB236|nr:MULTISPECIES: sn-glycerol-3-phosphate ABC transporter ATP-binding protein UgpC [unclassified Mesorhizobium]MBZ9735752.1 sn-glycerol-3-phosphate ABC transporter ATP-binding protein UgpC [Mesorhizobium sp. CA9]MBZ9817353.1 sn-glycerol-3-phosphate ABC transporter ATP-binding protein UgpC [Mesorhizobium sp. CA7]MBZ9827647.1 sn-glycerol-3-phosphate ABC transporter ATP-binding protein UgpC [Mesorhizobium sp. CA18]MBZ9833349.1 sn-glycerol-3-phosphate ABC transporter ATP-binding protein UgpC [Mesorh
MAFLDISSVSKSFDAHSVLEDVNLSIERGEFVVFVGPSGCGKSTLLRMISGLETVTSGTISIEGEIINDVEPAQRGAAMVFQSYALYPHMTVFQNISFGLRMAHRPRDEIAAKVRRAAAILRLDTLLERKPAQLSGGQKQRVAIGRAIVREPRVFLFDEPLSNLDAELRVQMRAELMDLHKRLGTTMIYVTHDQVEAMTLADRMVVMNGGRVQQAGKPLDLYDDPDNRFVAGFIGSPKMNFLPARVVDAAPGSLRLAVTNSIEVILPLSVPELAGRVELGLRPEHFLAVPERADEGGLELEGKVKLVEEVGSESYVHMDLGDGTPVVVRAARGSASINGTLRAKADLRHALVFTSDGRRIRGGNGSRG